MRNAKGPPMDAGLRELVWNRCRPALRVLPDAGRIRSSSVLHRPHHFSAASADAAVSSSSRRLARPFRVELSSFYGAPPVGRTTIDVLSTNDAPRMEHQRRLIEEQAFSPVERRFYCRNFRPVGFLPSNATPQAREGNAEIAKFSRLCVKQRHRIFMPMAWMLPCLAMIGNGEPDFTKAAMRAILDVCGDCDERTKETGDERAGTSSSRTAGIG